MRRRPLQAAAKWLALLLLIAIPRPAAADETFTGVVAEIGTADYNGETVYFRFTDPNITKGCKNNNNPDFVDYGYFSPVSHWGKAVLALALASKKGVTLSCKVFNKPSCQVRHCILQ